MNDSVALNGASRLAAGSEANDETSAMLLKLGQLDLGSKRLNGTVRSATVNGTLYDAESKLLKFIPSIPESYCFVDENFQNDAFSVDGFVKRNSKRVTSLEKLKEELTSYLKILKGAMIDLINEDYTEFINLSANLISFDKSINNIKAPILKFKDETSHVQSRIEDIIVQLTAKQNRVRTIRESKLRINMILEISTNLRRVEANMSQLSSSSISDVTGEETDSEAQIALPALDSALDENAILISRIQMNFDHLKESIDFSSEKNCGQLLAKLKERFDVCSRQFYNMLQRKIYLLLSYDLAKITDEATLNQITRSVEKIIRFYLLNDNQAELERIIIHDLVKPTFDVYICDSYIAKTGANIMFEKILQFVDTKCALLIKVLTSSSFSQLKSSDDSPTLSLLGYELLTRTLWSEVVSDCIVRCSSLFSLANADAFYRNYALTFRFIEDFLYKTSLVDYRDRFENEPTYHQLKNKFNLNVYFHMKLQQIVPTIEKGFTEHRFSLNSSSLPPNSAQYRTNVAHLVHESLFKCWQTSDQQKVYVGDLFGYLWKISLKIVSRYASWIASVSTEKIVEFCRASDPTTEKRLIHHTLAALILDTQLLLVNFASLYQSVIAPLWLGYVNRLQARIAKQNVSKRVPIQPSSLDGSFSEAMSGFHSAAIVYLVSLMKGEIVTACTPILDFVNDIPRLYRRTNKEKPGKASTYITRCAQTLAEMIGLLGMDQQRAEVWKQEWIVDLLSELMLHYKNATLEVLTSVQKTEDSLKKLKKAKAPTTPSNRALSSSMSDDDKIRLQIYFDVQELGTEMQSKLNLNLRTVKPYHELSEMVSSLKSLI